MKLTQNEIEYLREWYQGKTKKYLKSKLSNKELTGILHVLFETLISTGKE